MRFLILSMPMDAQSTVFASENISVPWWVTIVLVCAPAILAILLTLLATWQWKRINRADGNPPIKASTLMLGTIIIGGINGPVLQWGMQKLISLLIGVPVVHELIVVSIFITGMFSMGAYELLRWYAKHKNYKELYESLTVRHKKGIHNCGGGNDDSSYDSDFTTQTYKRKPK